MRKLTIKREKRFVGCLATMKVYIEDPTGGNMTINGCNCRKLGELKNGKKKSFHISEEAAKIFVIADKLSKDFCNECYSLPAGPEDIVLTGRNCFNPANGNAFRFDGADDPAVLENRKKSTDQGVVILVIALVACLMVGGIIGGTVVGFHVVKEIIASAYGPQEFQTDGLRIKLTNGFRETTVDGHTAFQSNDAVVIVQWERLGGASTISSVKEYAKAIQKANGHRASIYNDGTFLYYEYDDTNPTTGEKIHNLIMFKANDRNIYTVQFAVPRDKWGKMQDSVMEWARSVTV